MFGKLFKAIKSVFTTARDAQDAGLIRIKELDAAEKIVEGVDQIVEMKSK